MKLNENPEKRLRELWDEWLDKSEDGDKFLEYLASMIILLEAKVAALGGG